MAIPFARVAPLRLGKNSNLSRVVAYIARTVLRAPGRRAAYDYSHLRNDLAFEWLIGPAGLDRVRFAHTLDLAEMRKIRTPLWKRKRLPQAGLAVTVALPPKTEVTLHEAAEIMRRIVVTPSGSPQVPIHCTIHEAMINRHGHAIYGLRPIDMDGQPGHKVRDFVAHFRFRKAANGTEIVEGIDWPQVAWEVQRAFFLEIGIDLVVDPIAPIPGVHLAPFVYSNGEFHNDNTRRRVIESRKATYSENVRFIKGSETRLIEKMLRGRSSLQISELRRLGARFFDNEWTRAAEVDRILCDQNVITMTDVAKAPKPGYVTTRRIARLVNRATEMIERQGAGVIGVTGPDHDSVAAQIVAALADDDARNNRLLILGRSLSDCSALKILLADRHPLVGTIDMAVTGAAELRETGRKRNIRLRAGQTVIAPRAEKLDDQRLARLIRAVDRVGARLVLGHDQSLKTGVVCRHLAAYVVDRSVATQDRVADDHGPHAIERLLRSGLVRHAIDAMADQRMLSFGALPDRHPEEGFVVCCDPQLLEDVGNAVRKDRVRAGLLDKPETLAGPRTEMDLSLGEWIVTTGRRGVPTTMEAHQLAQIVAIDPMNNWIDVLHLGTSKRIDVNLDPAIRPAAAISVRDARGAPADANLDIILSDSRRTWSALVLAANRPGRATVHVDPAIAQTPDDLVEVARGSLPAALPSHRAIRPDDHAITSKILGGFDIEPIPDPETVEPQQTRPPIGFAEEFRHLLTKNAHTKLAYELLCQHVARQNSDNAERLISRCSSELTKTLIRFLTEIDVTPAHKDQLQEFDLPAQIAELEPSHCTPLELNRFERDLNEMTVRAFGWGLLPPARLKDLRRAPKTDPTTII